MSPTHPEKQERGVESRSLVSCRTLIGGNAHARATTDRPRDHVPFQKETRDRISLIISARVEMKYCLDKSWAFFSF